MSSPAISTTPPTPSTLGELRASGHELISIRAEIRKNLLTDLRAFLDPGSGLHGFQDTVVPQAERALLAGHDFVLLGERGQGKTRLLHTIVGLLDEWRLRWRVSLSPKAIRQLGTSLLRDGAARLSGKMGARDASQSGAACERTGSSRSREFGDSEPWNVPRTILDAQLRT